VSSRVSPGQRPPPVKRIGGGAAPSTSRCASTPSRRLADPPPCGGQGPARPIHRPVLAEVICKGCVRYRLAGYEWRSAGPGCCSHARPLFTGRRAAPLRPCPWSADGGASRGVWVEPQAHSVRFSRDLAPTCILAGRLRRAHHGTSMHSLGSLPLGQKWDERHAMLDRGEGDLHERDWVSLRPLCLPLTETAFSRRASTPAPQPPSLPIPKPHLNPQDGRTALHYAAMHGPLGLIHKLLARGADINAKDAYVRPTPRPPEPFSQPRAAVRHGDCVRNRARARHCPRQIAPPRHIRFR
jgi:hypothetical protein